MRICWVGLLIVLMAQSLLAQVEGEVESIGLGTYYRPECWVPMRVALRTTSDSAREVQIRVMQEDLDRDRVIQIRTVTLTPDVAGRGDKQGFWMYFRPQPSHQGLWDNDVSQGTNLKQLQQQLKVAIYTTDGKPVATLPLTQQSLHRVDGNSAVSNEIKARRMVLCVTDGRSLPALSEYGRYEGLSEEPLVVMVRPDDLPEDPRGYEMVDTVLWVGAAAPDPARPSEEPRFRALEQYVRSGGSLVVCQGAELNQSRGFESILPVRVSEMTETKALDPLGDMGRLSDQSLDRAAGKEASALRRIARARANAGALVVRTKLLGGETLPYLVRGRVGSGCVTWVAQDLGEPTLVRALRGNWVRVWDEVMGWKNTPTELPRGDDVNTIRAFSEPRGKCDMGTAFRRAGELGSRAAGYVLVAVVFFLAYWVVAGPGLYAWLSLRKLATLNWFLFGVAALAAAGLATLMVRFVHSGTPELDHVTIVHAPAGEPAVMESNISLLVRSSGLKRLELAPAAAHTASWVTPYPEHPIQHERQSSSGFLAMKQYDLEVQDPSSDKPVAVSIPWRSTTKRLQAMWTGDLAGRVEGQAFLTGRNSPEIGGTLVNNTGGDLYHVYLVYRGANTVGDGENAPGDRVLYIPKWAKDASLDLAATLSSDQVHRIGKDIGSNESVPRREQIVVGAIEAIHRGFGTAEVVPGEGWAGYWYANTAGDSDLFMGAQMDASSGYDVSVPLCSLFERVPPMRNKRDDGSGKFTESRKQILRVGSRFLDVSAAVMSGNLVVIGQANGALPIPLKVEGDAIGGNGLTIYQFILPIKRGSEAPAVNVEK